MVGPETDSSSPDESGGDSNEKLDMQDFDVKFKSLLEEAKKLIPDTKRYQEREKKEGEKRKIASFLAKLVGNKDLIDLLKTLNGLEITPWYQPSDIKTPLSLELSLEENGTIRNRFRLYINSDGQVCVSWDYGTETRKYRYDGSVSEEVSDIDKFVAMDQDKESIPFSDAIDDYTGNLGDIMVGALRGMTRLKNAIIYRDKEDRGNSIFSNR